MNPARTREVVDMLGISVEKSDDRGLEIHRALSSDTEIWRLRTGGGIVGNADQVWLQPILYRKPPQANGPYWNKTRGPYWNKTQLEKALRAWRRGE
jgi:hypothetical protein